MKNANTITTIILLSWVSLCIADCGDLEEGDIMANQIDPNTYFVCKNGFLEVRRCSEGSTFDPVAKQCTVEPTVEPPVNKVDCTDKDDGTIFPIEGKCSGYVICIGGEGQEGECGGNLQFNPTIGACMAHTCQD